MGERYNLAVKSVSLEGCSGARTFRPNGGARLVTSLLVSECAFCGADLIAPEWSEHVSDHCVRNVWLCEACGREIKDTVYLSARAVESLRD
jgi:hypothetical protein